MTKRSRISGNYWRKRCLRHRMAPARIVYDETSDTAAKLLRRKRRYFPLGQTLAGTQVAGYLPRCWRKIDVKGTSRSLRAALLFLHERRTAAGHRQLVAVSYAYLIWKKGAVLMGKSGNEGFGDIRVPPQFHVLVYDIGDWSRPPRCMSTDYFTGIHDGDPFDVRKTVRFYAGQRDRKDASRFTIDYEVDGVRGTTKWQLLDLRDDERPSRLSRTIIKFERDGPSR